MHTPTPWHIRPDYGKENVYRLWNADDNYPDDTSPEVMDDNAEFIVRAVNAHEAMREALAYTIEYASKLEKALGHTSANVSLDGPRKALALAEGKGER